MESVVTLVLYQQLPIQSRAISNYFNNQYRSGDGDAAEHCFKYETEDRIDPLQR